MSAASTEREPWQVTNQRHLVAAIGRVRAALERHGGVPPAVAPAEPAPPEGEAGGQAIQPALERVVAAFGLSPFERDTLLLCTGVELDGALPGLCARAQGGPEAPTFGLALAALPGAHWSAIAPDGPLRRWRLVEVGPGAALTRSPLRIAEQLLHYLAGSPQLDAQLALAVEPVEPPATLAPSQVALAERLAGVWIRHAGQALPALQLGGGDAGDRRAVAAAACAMLGLELYLLPEGAVPHELAERDALLRLWEREALLSGAALLIEAGDDALDPAREHAAGWLAERALGGVILAGPRRGQLRRRAVHSFELRRLAPAEQRQLWRGALGAAGAALDGQIDRLAGQFSLSATGIAGACAAAVEELAGAEDGGGGWSPAQVGAALWAQCRAAARPRLDALAQPIEPSAVWDDLVLPEAQLAALRAIAVQCRQRATVYERWGFGAGGRGLGLSALFAGGSGTGKTMAAEVLAGELGLDLYKIDLSQVVSKYIGETEKNLARVFDAAEAGGCVLLFDEADALFGKRSEVKDSHDRHANIEVSYLLQRMESYRGLSILTTNMRQALDQAFLRRLRFVVQFPFPDAAQRAQIWRAVFPAATPTGGLDVAKLARLNVAGGNIRNIALGAAFLAAEEGAAVEMRHLLAAAQGEYAKLEKPMAPAEVAGWL